MVEQSAVNRWVVGSSPTFGANFIEENEESEAQRTDSAQNPPDSESGHLKFPRVIRHRRAEVTIYGKKESYPFYRIAYRASGKRRMESFRTYGEAKAAADKKVRELSEGNQSLALTNKEVTEALAIRDAVAEFRLDTGRTVTGLQIVTQALPAMKVLGDRLSPRWRKPTWQRRRWCNAKRWAKRSRSLSKAVGTSWWRRKASEQSVPRFTSAMCAAWLTEFAGAFPGHAVCDLTKEHLNVLTSEGSWNFPPKAATTGASLSNVPPLVRGERLPAAESPAI